MFTRSMYHGLGTDGYRSTRTEYQQGGLVFGFDKDRWFDTLPIESGHAQ